MKKNNNNTEINANIHAKTQQPIANIFFFGKCLANERICNIFAKNKTGSFRNSPFRLTNRDKKIPEKKKNKHCQRIVRSGLLKFVTNILVHIFKLADKFFYCFMILPKKKFLVVWYLFVFAKKKKKRTKLDKRVFRPSLFVLFS